MQEAGGDREDVGSTRIKLASSPCDLGGWGSVNPVAGDIEVRMEDAQVSGPWDSGPFFG